MIASRVLKIEEFNATGVEVTGINFQIVRMVQKFNRSVREQARKENHLKLAVQCR